MKSLGKKIKEKEKERNRNEEEEGDGQGGFELPHRATNCENFVNERWRVD